MELLAQPKLKWKNWFNIIVKNYKAKLWLIKAVLFNKKSIKNKTNMSKILLNKIFIKIPRPGKNSHWINAGSVNNKMLQCNKDFFNRISIVFQKIFKIINNCAIKNHFYKNKKMLICRLSSKKWQRRPIFILLKK